MKPLLKTKNFLYNRNMSNHQPQNEITSLRYWNETDLELYPLLLSREPQSYSHQCSIFLVKKDHPDYDRLCKTISNWYSEIPRGTEVKIDGFEKYSLDEFTPKSWAIWDFRKDKGNFSNKIQFTHWNELSPHTKNRIAFEIYERVKGLVVFADSIHDVPNVLRSLCIFGCSEQNTDELYHFLMETCFTVPKNEIPYRTDNRLLGFTKMEKEPTFIAF